MRILELSLRNYRVFDEVDLELPARVIGIFGPNGAGKSSLLESVQYGFYGKARTDKKQIRTDGVLTDCAVRLVFEHGGRQYEVRRIIRGRNHQTDAELFVGDSQLASGVTEVDQEIERLLRMDVHVFRASVFAEQKQLDAFSEVTKGKRKEMVLRLLGIRPVDDARTTARKETRETRGNAERIAETVPDLSQQERALEEARARSREAEARATAATVALAEGEGRWKVAAEDFSASGAVRQRVEKLEVERQALADQADQLDQHRAALAERIEAIRTDLQDLPEIEKAVADLADAPARLAAGRRLVEVVEEVEAFRCELDLLPEANAEAALAELRVAQEELDAAQRAHTRAESAHERVAEELAAAQAALDRAGEADPSQPCPTCGRPLGDDFAEYLAHCERAVAGARKQEASAKQNLKETAASLKAAKRRSSAASKAGEDAHRAVQARATVEEQLAKGRKRLEELAEPFGGRVPDLGEIEEAASRAGELGRRAIALRAHGERLAETEADLAKTMNALRQPRARIEEVDREIAGLAFDLEDHARLEKERNEARDLLEAARAEERLAAAALAEANEVVGRLEGALQQARQTAAKVGELRDEARYLERVSVLLDGFRDHLVARIGPDLSREAEALFRDLTNREYDDLKIDEETLAIHIADGERYFPIERFSGSEADLANLALRVAISMHLSRVSGADVGMMVLDEVLGSLDVERKDLFVQTMGRLAGRFHQLFVITHAEQVKDQFPASIEVRKVGRRRSQAVLA